MNDLTPEEINELRKKLHILKDELGKLLSLSKNSVEPVDLGEPIGRLSRMDALQQQSMAKANREGHEIRLRQVTAALSAVNNEEYGYCRRCEEPIGYPRLNARPETPFCFSCQGDIESRR